VACALDLDPPKITVVIDKSAYTHELIEATGTFAINVPCVAQVDVVRKVGTTSGRDLVETDKFTENSLETFSATAIDAPLLKGCVAWLECKLILEPHNQNYYDLFIAEVVAAQADERVFNDGHWHFEGYDDLRTIHHIAGRAFFAMGAAIQTTL
jgi:flavin reductase (DIM6/NTAB) family NADH-FMN oxidoreductase RutF